VTPFLEGRPIRENESDGLRHVEGRETRYHCIQVVTEITPTPFRG